MIAAKRVRPGGAAQHHHPQRGIARVEPRGRLGQQVERLDINRTHAPAGVLEPDRGICEELAVVESASDLGHLEVGVEGAVGLAGPEVRLTQIESDQGLALGIGHSQLQRAQQRLGGLIERQRRVGRGRRPEVGLDRPIGATE